VPHPPANTPSGKAVPRSAASSEEPSIFERAFCGVDGTPEALEAARQLALLAPAGSVLRLLAAVNPGAAAPAGVERTRSVPELEDEARHQLERMAAELPAGARCEQLLVVGLEIEAILAELNRSSATLSRSAAPTTDGSWAPCWGMWRARCSIALPAPC
jgi:hypothetical protein